MPKFHQYRWVGSERLPKTSFFFTDVYVYTLVTVLLFYGEILKVDQRFFPLPLRLKFKGYRFSLLKDQKTIDKSHFIKTVDFFPVCLVRKIPL